MKHFHTISLSFLFALTAFNSHAASNNTQALQTILDQQAPAIKARYTYRHPLETLEFFGIKPGMKVAEVLPDGAWYTRILAPYIGSQGQLIALDYPKDMWPLFDWATEEYLNSHFMEAESFSLSLKQWAANNTPSAASYTYKQLPASLDNSLDAVLFIRALHNLARFNDSHHFLDDSLADSYRILKPGGIVGIVQHESSAKNANGSNGYLNHDELIQHMQKAGFTLVAESDINKNPKDKPVGDDYVWRLPPSLDTESEELKQAYLAIGESNRMTLLFKK